MRDARERVVKYAAKADGSAIRRQYAAYGGRQRAGFRRAAGDQVAIERKVKGILSSQGVMVGLNHFYMDFGKKLDRLRRTYSGGTLADEVCIEYGKWSSRGLSTAVLDLIVAAFGLPSCVPPPPVCGWLYRSKLTFSGNVSTTDLDDFPVLVHLTAANFNFAHAQASGQDIRFMDSATCPGDGTPLRHEIEYWSQPLQEAFVWVKVPRIDGNSATDFIYMYFGNAAAPDAQDAPGTWSNNYGAVWHLNALAAPDSSGNGHAATGVTGTPDVVAGKIYNGIQFVPTESVNFGDIDAFDGIPSITVECWVKVNADADGAVYSNLSADWTKGLLFFYEHTGNKMYAVINVSGTFPGGYRDIQASTALNIGTWYHVALVKDGDALRMYLNGAADGTSAGNAGNIYPSTEQVKIGRNAGGASGTRNLTGIVDEERVSPIARTGDWIKAQYKSMVETLITFGPEEPA